VLFATRKQHLFGLIKKLPLYVCFFTSEYKKEDEAEEID
jgi:hypothetical protein